MILTSTKGCIKFEKFEEKVSQPNPKMKDVKRREWRRMDRHTMCTSQPTSIQPCKLEGT